MVADVHYFSPTTPGASSFDVDVSDFVRRGRIGPLSGEAEMAAVGTGNQELDDVDGTLGHDDDSILGLKQWYFDETECPSGNQRVYTGYTFDRRYARADSLVQGVARNTDVTLMDLNSFLSFRVFAPEDSDPTSSFVRPAETTIERIQALLNDVDFLSTTLFDLGYIPTTGGVDMDANDYTQQKPYDVVNSIAQVSGWNPWVGYDETENKLFLWFDDWKTDGSDTVPYDSTLRLTNVASEVDATTLLIELNGVENIDPSRVISAVWVNGKDGVSVYRTLPSTAWTFGWRDAVMDATYLSDPVKLAALGDRYLADNATEDHRISVTVQVPAALVTAIHEGMRIQLHATHMPSVTGGFTWCRILQRTVRREVETMEFYWLDLELSPIPEVCEVLLEKQNTVIESTNRDADTGGIDAGCGDLRGTTWHYRATNPFHDDLALTNPWDHVGSPNVPFTWRLAVVAGVGGSVGDPAADHIMVNLSPLPLSQGTSAPFSAVPPQEGTFTVPLGLSDPPDSLVSFGFIAGADYAPGAITIDEGWRIELERVS